VIPSHSFHFYILSLIQSFYWLLLIFQFYSIVLFISWLTVHVHWNVLMFVTIRFHSLMSDSFPTISSEPDLVLRCSLVIMFRYWCSCICVLFHYTFPFLLPQALRWFILRCSVHYDLLSSIPRCCSIRLLLLFVTIWYTTVYYYYSFGLLMSQTICGSLIFIHLPFLYVVVLRCSLPICSFHFWSGTCILRVVVFVSLGAFRVWFCFDTCCLFYSIHFWYSVVPFDVGIFIPIYSIWNVPCCYSFLLLPTFYSILTTFGVPERLFDICW